ncbi:MULTISPECIES: alpha/beta fold hydrolase [unclassified Mycobacterium]|uniref:alpha/beta fold hydrolase n=1 Tax=unclassified Mycobacterium TaxID=2642494 RepID=UPI002740F41C|nr:MULTISPECIES: alpha/beta fold hydrolase [unclassified Mycobacterium]MDP7705387.1 alpha/beta fold hydrolase [Mycobacterium sp. TY815]MDP7724833.1 alpha/beta fold hydrolase [Mycobacterium sp. TY814]
MTNRSRRHLRPVRDVTAPALQFRTIHGHRRAFRIAGSGPVVVLLHGVGDSSTTWEPVHAKLAQRFTVIAPDMLGHGESDKPRADYSLAAFANGLRDLLTALEIDRVTLVGHSLGGGLAAQFAYQYPQFVERVVLVSAGGVTTEVSAALRFAAMPMGAEMLSALRLPGAVPALGLVSRAVGHVAGSTRLTRDVASLPRLVGGLRKPGAVEAFARTLRAVVDTRGQYVTMLDRTYLMHDLPVQIIWGEDDLIIPAHHARVAHEQIPGSRLEIFEESGHMPHGDHPDRFVEVVQRFIDSTAPYEHQPELMRKALQTGVRQYADVDAESDLA